jgi:hypothetical protein
MLLKASILSFQVMGTGEFVSIFSERENALIVSESAG